MCLCLLIRDIYFVYHNYKKVTNMYFLTLFVSRFLEKWDRKGGQGKFPTSIKVKVLKGTHSIGWALLSPGAGRRVDFLRAVIRDLSPL